MTLTSYHGGLIFDGAALHQGYVLQCSDGVISAFGPLEEVGLAGTVVDLEGDILSPGYVDLQVNGGDGVMLNDALTQETLQRMAAAHRRLGATHILPTLITNTLVKTEAAITVTEAAIAEGVPGIAGLHLEGPHLSVARKGAHDGAPIRPMLDSDLDMLCQAAQRLPALMLTVAPENVTQDQVRALVAAGAVVSLGHSDADYDTACAYFAAGARCATHLFNAMSQMGNRAPGLVGAALECGAVSAGLIADGIHVHPASMRAAWAAKQGPGQIFLVSDAMAPAGTDVTGFQLEGRQINRQAGRLTLEDGTLAGADLELTGAVRTLHHSVGVALDAALAAATSIPADLMGFDAGVGRISVGYPSDLIRIHADLSGCVCL
jgi:N-acetylglucosamine-6-phosphate deacetylase